MALPLLITTLWFLFVAASPAYAYVDPGSGGMMMQLLLGGITGLVVLGRLYWRRFLEFLRLRTPDTETP